MGPGLKGPTPGGVEEEVFEDIQVGHLKVSAKKALLFGLSSEVVSKKLRSSGSGVLRTSASLDADAMQAAKKASKGGKGTGESQELKDGGEEDRGGMNRPCDPLHRHQGSTL